jgi:hypothetical protein
MGASHTGGQTFRSLPLTVLSWVAAAGFGAAFLTLAVLTLVAGDFHRNTGDRLTSALLMLFLAMAFALVFSRIARVKLVVDEHEVTVRNPWKSFVFQRAEVDRFEVSSLGNWAMLRTRSGRRVPVFAVSVGLRWTFRRRMADLNTRLGLSDA